MRGIVAAAAACLWFGLGPASAQQLQLGIERIEHPGFSARDLRLRLSDNDAAVDIGELRIAGREWHGIRLRCGEVVWRAGVSNAAPAK